jgi:hypothetical protein
VVTDARVLLVSLVGRDLRTLTGRGNRILRVEADHVVVATERSPQGQPVEISDVQSALDRLNRDGELEISVASVGYRSAFVGAVLTTIPGTQTAVKPRRVYLGRG